MRRRSRRSDTLAADRWPRCRLGTRGSQLALFQANTVAALLRERRRRRRARSSSSRRRAIGWPTRRCREIGGKRLFVKEIEDALLAGDDRPRGAQQQGHAGRAAGRPRRSAPCCRARTPRDAVVLPAPAGATAAVRATRVRAAGPRAAHRHQQRPAGRAADARCSRARGSCRFAAISTRGCASSTRASTTRSCSPPPACAGCSRRAHLGALPPDVCVPAPGQGIIAVEIRDGRRRDVPTSSQQIDDARRARRRSRAERAVVDAPGRRLPDADRRATPTVAGDTTDADRRRDRRSTAAASRAPRRRARRTTRQRVGVAAAERAAAPAAPDDILADVQRGARRGRRPPAMRRPRSI